MDLPVVIVFLTLFGLFYFVPTIVGRHKKNWATILLCNLFFGCTGVGWIICFIWAMSEDKPNNTIS